MLESAKEKRAELTFASVGHAEIVSGQQPREEFLGQILSVVRCMALSARVSVERIPIRPAQLRQGLRGFWRIPLSRLKHHAPMRRGKNCRSRRLLSVLILACSHKVKPMKKVWRGIARWNQANSAPR